ncbi:hypothetical protein N656DRAFT_453022 [Canariomyces notabilis]|uniref:Uncharacterized protein n=1 Tax=Canariomyces notabilis TaxID=2074819 RepID=A0AAN6T7X8_9PEZI|nr:hypothetical protein N656DRAFT_453022 [Canariomyces arenarius]
MFARRSFPSGRALHCLQGDGSCHFGGDGQYQRRYRRIRRCKTCRAMHNIPSQANVLLLTWWRSLLLSLPPIIFDEIIQTLVDNNDGRAGLASLAQTCRYIHDRLTPILYREIEDPTIYSVVGNEVARSNRVRPTTLGLPIPFHSPSGHFGDELQFHWQTRYR